MLEKGILVTNAETLWTAIQNCLSLRNWTPLQTIYVRVMDSVALDAEDHLPEAPSSSAPKWKRNVRNVLQRRRSTGEVDWNRAAAYKLMSKD